MAKRWSCVEAHCDWVVIAPDAGSIMQLAQEHIATAHHSFELDDFIEAALEDVPDETGTADGGT